MLEAFSFRNADTSSRSSVCTLSLEPCSRRTWNVFGPEPDVRSRSPTPVRYTKLAPARLACTRAGVGQSGGAVRGHRRDVRFEPNNRNGIADGAEREIRGWLEMYRVSCHIIHGS